jgi:3'-5' exoribonuclease
MKIADSQANRNTVSAKSVFVSELAPGLEVDDLFLLAEADSRQARNGPMWHLLLEDKTGQVPGKIFHPHSMGVAGLAPGMIVRLRGQVGVWRDLPQIVAEEVQVLDPEEDGLDPADFAAASVREPEEMMAELEALVRENIRHKPWRKLLASVLTDKDVRPRLLRAPGGKSIHHAYLGGLLEHTLAVSRLCLSFCALYPGLDRELLLAAAILHDLGKAWEYGQGPVREVTDEGRLLGHIHIGFEVLAPHLAKAKGLDPELATHLKHVILAHHGEYEFGSPRLPMTAEAMALHFADNLDAKLNSCEAALAEMPEGNDPGWSTFQRSMQRYLYRARRTPGNENGKAENGEDRSRQCSLPLKA